MNILKNIIAVILFLVSIIIAALLPFEGLFYTMQKSVSKESPDSVGLPAGEGIIRVQSIEEMEQYKYFTIQTDSMTPTGVYCIIDPNDGGTKTGGTRKRRSTWTVPYYATSGVYPVIHKLTYGQFYIASLSNGENVVVLISNTLIPTSGNKQRTLPVGEIKYMPSGSLYGGNYIENYFRVNAEKYGLLSNTSWYVNMTSISFKDEYKTPAIVIQFILTIIIAAVLIKILDKIFQRFKCEKNY